MGRGSDTDSILYGATPPRRSTALLIPVEEQWELLNEIEQCVLLGLYDAVIASEAREENGGPEVIAAAMHLKFRKYRPQVGVETSSQALIDIARKTTDVITRTATLEPGVYVTYEYWGLAPEAKKFLASRLEIDVIDP